MIEAAAYEQNELIHKIRSEHGTNPGFNKGVPITSEFLQDRIRPDTSRSVSTSDTGPDTYSGSPGLEGGTTRGSGTREGSDSREGRASSEAHQSDGGDNRSNNPIGRAFQFKQTDDGDYIDEEKPSGLKIRPHAKEQRARQEQKQADGGGSSPSQTQGKKNFFSWLRSSDNRKTAKEPKAKRTRPLTEKEIEELKPDLVDALREGLPILDQVILATNKAHAKPYIFGSFDDEDIDKIANWWLKKARKSAEMAEAAKQLANYHDDIEMLTMIVPTIPQTFNFYRDNGGITLRGR